MGTTTRCNVTLDVDLARRLGFHHLNGAFVEKLLCEEKQMGFER